jgi:hypothetical protein
MPHAGMKTTTLRGTLSVSALAVRHGAVTVA